MNIERENMMVEDTMDRLIETKEGITCGCGNPRLKTVCHIDGRDFYSYSYSCDCGNSIIMKCKRSEEDLMMY